MFGYEAVKEPGGRVQAVEALGVPQPELAVRVNGAAMIAGGAALATDICARTVAVGLALALVPTSLAGHPYWKESDDSKRFSEIIHFRKNMALAGALAAYAFRKYLSRKTCHRCCPVARIVRRFCGLAFDIPSDEGLNQIVGLFIVVLYRWGLHEVARRR